MINYLKRISAEGKTIVLFGASQKGCNFLKLAQKEDIKVSFFCDNNKEKWGKTFEGFPIISVEELKNMPKDEVVILITSVYYSEIMKQIKEYGFKEVYRYKDVYNQKRESFDKLTFPVPGENIDISILLTAYNEWEYTYNCLKSILDKKTKCNYEIIVGDNLSDDETKNIRNYVENIRVIRHETNIHYLKNCNAIAKEAKGKYLVLLSNDTLIKDDYWLDILLEHMEYDKTVGMVGVSVYEPEFLEKFEGGYFTIENCIVPYDKGTGYREMEYVSPSCAMVRKSVWDLIGGFDEIYYPAWFEDIDFMFSVRKNGFKVMTEPKILVLHHGSITYGAGSLSGNMDWVEHREIFLNRWRDTIDKKN